MDSGDQQNARKLEGRAANLTNAGKGRVKGVPNKATADLKRLAGQYTEAAIIELARLAFHAENENTRVSAIKEIFDRAFGKAPQSHSVNHSGEVVVTKEQREAAIRNAILRQERRLTH